MSVETDHLLGSDLAGYRIESVLGRGGMGVVYLATDLRLKRRVALKLVAPELAADARFRERFLREAELAASFDHSHVVPVHAAGETDGQLWIAMRYVQGTDLRTLLEAEGPLEPARALGLVSQVATALDAAHAHGLVHRDVKPANVLVTQEGDEEHCYLSDFGLARSPSDEQVAAGAHLSGTIDYTAPEQIAHDTLDCRADVYSLGCVLYECLTGEPPFKRPRPTATLFAHASEPPPSLHARRPELSEAVDEVTAKALAKDPEERYDTCRELCQAAETALGLGRPRFTRRRFVLAGTGAAIAIAAAAAVPTVLLGGGSAGQAAEPNVPLPLTEDSLVRIDAATSDLVEAIPLGSTVDALAVGDGSVWVASARERVLTQIDPRTNTVLNEVDVSRTGSPGLLAARDGSVWVGSVGFFGELWKYDTRTAVLSEVPDLVPLGVATGEGAVWVPSSPRAVVKISPTTGQPGSTTQVAGPDQCGCFPGFLAAGEGSVWVVGGPERPDTVWQIDADTGKVVAEIKLGFATTAIAAGTGAAWVTNPDDDSIARIDPATSQVVQTIRVGRIPSSVAVADGFVWVASARDGSVTRVNPDTADVETIDVGGTPTDIAVGPGAVWVAVDVR